MIFTDSFFNLFIKEYSLFESSLHRSSFSRIDCRIDCPLDKALEDEIRIQEKTKCKDPGLKIVLLPSQYGKSTSMKYVLDKLKENEIIHDFKYLDYTKDEHIRINNYIRTEKDMIYVVDNIDHISESEIKKLLYYCWRYAMLSVSFPFQIFLLTHRTDIAKELLTINDGSKVRLLGEGDELFGCSEYVESHWAHKGLKLKKEDIQKYTQKYTRNTESISPKELESLEDLCVKSGTVGFLIHVLNILENGSLKPQVFNDLESIASSKEKEWIECSKVKEHWWYR
jgi:hypothetical protein